jgi:hypothetical protein
MDVLLVLMLDLQRFTPCILFYMPIALFAWASRELEHFTLCSLSKSIFWELMMSLSVI